MEISGLQKKSSSLLGNLLPNLYQSALKQFFSASEDERKRGKIIFLFRVLSSLEIKLQSKRLSHKMNLEKARKKTNELRSFGMRKIEP